MWRGAPDYSALSDDTRDCEGTAAFIGPIKVCLMILMHRELHERGGTSTASQANVRTNTESVSEDVVVTISTD